MIFLAKGTFRFCLVLLRELLLSPILYVKNILILEKAVKRRVRKPVTTDTVYVEVHEWAGYPISRMKQLKNGRIFQCGLEYQLGRFNMAKRYSKYKVDLTVTVSDIDNYPYDMKYLKGNCDRVLSVPNIGLDFSGYASFFQLVKDKPNSYVILSNSSINSSIDIFLDGYIEYLEENPDVGMLGVSYCTKMYQTLIRNNFTPHLQSFFLLTTVEVLKELVHLNGDKFPGIDITNKQLLIRNGEIKLSQLIMNLGYKLAVVRPDNGEPFKFTNKKAWNILKGDVRQAVNCPNRITPAILKNKKNMKVIGYVSVANPFEDRKAWSGTIFKIREGLENAGYNVVWIPIKLGFLYRFANILSRFIYGKGPREHGNFLTWIRAVSTSWELIGTCDYLFFPGDCQITKYRKVDKPIIYYSDATFKQMIGYYWKDLSGLLLREGDRNERIANDNSTIIIKSSHWAINSVVTDYQQKASKCHVLEFGANIDERDIVKTDIYHGGPVNILFSGVEWERKGADIAIDTVKELNRKGVEAKLFLVGIKEENIPEKYKNISCVDYVGFLNKNIPEQYQKLITIMGRCNLFLLPTKAKCAGIVLCEASAFGLPIFTFDTGGIGNYVIDGMNGYKLTMDADANAFATKIKEVIETNELLKLREGCLSFYEEKLNWKAWANNFKKLMNDAML